MIDESGRGGGDGRGLVAGIFLVCLLAGCQPSTAAPSGSGATPPAASPTREIVPPPSTGRFDYQLGGAYAPTAGLDVVVRDVTASPLQGVYNVCYVNGFQTQPGDELAWQGENESLLLHDDRGRLVVDPDWPDEHILDPSGREQRERILSLVGPVIVQCADKGFDAVEIDNIDTSSRFDDRTSGFIDPAGSRDLATLYVELAHAHGLAIGQKNAAELAETGRRDLGFDFAITEECAAYDECAAFTSVYGENVLQIEYVDNLPVPFATVCAADERAPLTILRDRDLVPPGSDGYVYEQCPPKS